MTPRIGDWRVIAYTLAVTILVLARGAAVGRIAATTSTLSLARLTTRNISRVAHHARRIPPAALIPALVPVVVFGKALIGRALLAPGDAYIYYLPVHVLTARAWRHLTIPGWNPFSFSGSVLLAANQPAAFYPPNVLFVLLPPFAANNILVVFNLSVAAVGAFILARRLTGDSLASAVAGVAFVSCGFMYAHIAHQSLEASVAWIPWVLNGYLALRERVTTGRLFLTSLALALCLLAGQSQMFFVTILALAVYALVLHSLERPGGMTRAGRGVAIVGIVAVVEVLSGKSGNRGAFWLVNIALIALWLGLALRRSIHAKTGRRLRPAWRFMPAPLVVVCALGLAAIQWLPTASIVSDTVRSKLTFNAATSYSLPGSHLPLLLFPYLFGNNFHFAPFDTPYTGEWNLTELIVYPGLACLVLAAAGARRACRDPRTAALGIVGLAFLLIALGATTGAGELVWATPVYGQFRAWARYGVFLDLAVAVWAAHGVALLRNARHDERRAAIRRAWSAVAVLALIALSVPLISAVAHHIVNARVAALAVAIPLTAALCAAIACHLFAKRPGLAAGLCCFIVAVDGLASFGAFYEWRSSPTPAEARAAYSPHIAPPWGRLPPLPGGVERYLFAGHEIEGTLPYLPQLTGLKNLPSLNGYDPLAPKTYVEDVGGMDVSGTLERPEQFLSYPSSLLNVLRVSLVLAPLADAPKHPTPALKPLPRKFGLARYAYRPTVPDAYLVGGVQQGSNEDAIRALSQPDPFPLRRLAFVDGTCGPCPALTTPGAAGVVLSETRSDESIHLRVRASRAALVVVSESWFPGWTATVDGGSASVLRTDGVVMGVAVPPGTYDVTLRYRPPGLPLGAAATAATLAAFGSAWAVIRQRRRRSRNAAPSQ